MARGAPRRPPELRGREGLSGASGRQGGRRGGGWKRLQSAQLGEVESVQRWPGVCSRPWVSGLLTKCHLVTSARASPAIASVPRCVGKDHSLTPLLRETQRAVLTADPDTVGSPVRCVPWPGEGVTMRRFAEVSPFPRSLSGAP